MVLKEIDKALNITEPFKNRCGINPKTGNIDNIDDFISCTLTVMSLVSMNPTIKGTSVGIKLLSEASYGLKLLNLLRKL